MKIRTLSMAAVCALAACSTNETRHSPGTAINGTPSGKTTQESVLIPAASASRTVDAYKAEVAHRISHLHRQQVYSENPQPLLRSVVVVRYSVNADGSLINAQIQRSNKDHETEKTALASLKNSAPLPKPHPQLLRSGRLEVSETWLFNDDGRFQIRSIALPQRAG
ncbi:TonB family protein [Undibacterium sp. 14-3-2]|uniref:TonB family protein n=1 Tax=Undibacterium sp. 14-3-2 TaxID=2800129 RepID=UPI001904B4C3|nr:TonB family protein [Undibacterium sp. 14-3-2]MBK1889027.1 TonB family protein [Undibacterium sp. 14-3-2]